jgi:hypothetical protein
MTNTQRHCRPLFLDHDHVHSTTASSYPTLIFPSLFFLIIPYSRRHICHKASTSCPRCIISFPPFGTNRTSPASNLVAQIASRSKNGPTAPGQDAVPCRGTKVQTIQRHCSFYTQMLSQFRARTSHIVGTHSTTLQVCLSLLCTSPLTKPQLLAPLIIVVDYCKTAGIQSKNINICTAHRYQWSNVLPTNGLVPVLQPFRRHFVVMYHRLRSRTLNLFLSTPTRLLVLCSCPEGFDNNGPQLHFLFKLWSHSF